MRFALIATATLLVTTAIAVAAFPGLTNELEPTSTYAESPTTAASAAGTARAPVAWTGYARTGVADAFAHTAETEPIVAPLARMGFDIDVPAGTTALEFRLVFPEGVPMHLMVHGPHDAGMPTYMGGWPDSGDACFAIPADEIVAGQWKVMAHVERTAVDVEFTVEVRTMGVADAAVVPGWHGHAATEDMPMSMQEPETCNLE